ncbi:MAG: glycosyl transferase family 1 [Alphaproteobacteria bacterium 41-28]|nr:MAG: glycosyl transferase family 1 [Alphaproteobacteria bacterium 41-28]
MKVLHFYKTSLPDSIGGIEQAIHQIVRGTAQLGVTPEVLSLNPLNTESIVDFDGYRVHRCRTTFEIASTPFSIVAFHRFLQLASKADIIHYHFPYPFADVLHFSTRVKKPTILTYHSDIIKQKVLLKLYNPLKRLFLADIDHIIATSPNYLATSDDLRMFQNKTSVIPIGLDKSTYPSPSDRRLNFWRQRFGEKFFLFIGVFRYYKGLHILIDAASTIDYPIVILGAGPIENELKEQVAKLGIHNIHFIGQLPNEDKIALLQLCYAVVFPSHLRSEAFGISLLEGAMFGKPMISCEIGTGTTYVNIDKETGIVVPPGDPSRLREALQFLIERPDEARVLGIRAEKRYWTHFTAEKMAKSYADIYESLVRGT